MSTVASTARAAVTQPVALTCTSVAVVTAMPADSHARHSQMRRDGRSPTTAKFNSAASGKVVHLEIWKKPMELNLLGGMGLG